ncbi:MAG: hypothetical protein QNJ22_01655 [Desulfosarcinaceae bacterium]|nr:hypothetical protein [Desulfosarcinaceae bacterium]
MADAGLKRTPLIVCGDINDGPGLDAGEKKLFGSAVEKLMGSIWHSRRYLGNAIFDALPEEKQAQEKFQAVSTTSFKDPLFNYMRHHVWIDHILYSRTHGHQWVTRPKNHEQLRGAEIGDLYPHASDHYPLSVAIDLSARQSINSAVHEVGRNP